MPSVDDQRDTAYQQLLLYLPIDTEPALSDPEVNALLDATQRASIWDDATAYTYGQIILPTARNGHTYKCIVAGTSGATEPVWPLSTERQIQDGTGSPVLVWQENGMDYTNVFDVRAAVHAGWMLKASKASDNYQIRQGGYNDHYHQQIYDHCVEMAQRWAPLVIG